MSLLQPINVYTCQKCGESVITKDIAEGVTPFMIGCIVNPKDFEINEGKSAFTHMEKGTRPSCDGTMYSHFYDDRNWALKPQYEWYTPDAEEYNTLHPAMKEGHVDKGGLLLRPVKSV